MFICQLKTQVRSKKLKTNKNRTSWSEKGLALESSTCVFFIRIHTDSEVKSVEQSLVVGRMSLCHDVNIYKL